MLPIDMMTVSS